MDEKKNKAKLWLIISAIAIVISIVGAGLIQTSGGRVDMRHVIWETNAGPMSAWLLVPDGVSAENPAPAIVTSHGMFNNRGMQDLNFVELSRRGFVVLAIDMFSHGDSANVPGIGIIVGSSINEGVLKLSRLNFVDTSRIGVTGHSLGGMSANTAVSIDDGRSQPLIRAVLISAANPVAIAAGEFVNHYGSRHAGVIAPMHEEFFMLDADAAGNRTRPRDWINYNTAQAFLHFGQDPTGLPQRQSGTLYSQMIDGVNAIRVAYTPSIIHPWAHFSAQAANAAIEFFTAALDAPNPIAPSNQIWQWKAAFNLLGLVAIFVFLVNFVTLMVFTTFFEELRAKELVKPMAAQSAGKIWFFALMAVAALVAAITYLPVLRETGAFPSTADGFRQTQSFGIASWAAINGIVSLALMCIYYFAHGKKNGGLSLSERGIAIGCKKLGKTILLAIVSVTVFFGILFLADFFFMVDFRIWTIALRPFSANTLLFAFFPYMLFMAVFFIANSISATAFGYNDIGQKKWVNMLIYSALNVLPVVALIAMQYISLFATGWLFFGDHAGLEGGVQAPYQMFAVWLFPFVAILSLTPVIARKIYRVTNNPYLPGIINAAIITMMAAANTLTWMVG